MECVTEDSDKRDVFDTVRSDLQEGAEIVLVTLSSTVRDFAEHKHCRNQWAKLIRGINKTQKISINRKNNVSRKKTILHVPEI